MTKELNPTGDDLAALPQPIMDVLQRVIRRRRGVILLRGTLAVAGTALTMLLILMALDALVAIPSAVVRRLLSAAALAVITASALWFLIRPLRRRMTLTRMAQLVDTHHPEFEERVSSVVELLSSRGGRSGQASPELIGELTREAVRQVRAVEPQREFNLRTVRPYAGVVCAAVAVLAGLWIVWPQQTLRLLGRAVLPRLEAGNLRGETLRVRPGTVTVGHGDPLRIEVELDDERAQAAQFLQQDAAGGETARPMVRIERITDMPAKFVLDLPPVEEPFRYRVLVDHAALSSFFDVWVVPRPAVSRYDFQLDFPEYTGLPPQSQPDATGDVEAPLGTVITLAATFNKPLAEAKLLLAGQTTVDGGLDAGGASATWKIALDPKTAGKWRLVLKDEHGLETQTAEHELRALADATPLVALAEPAGGEVRLRPNDRLPISYRVREDYGVAGARLAIQAGPQRQESVAASLPQHSTIERGTWVGQTVLDLNTLALSGVPRIQVQVEVSDTRPESLGGAQRGQSRIVTIVFDNNAARYSSQWTDAQSGKIAAVLNEAVNLLTSAKQQTASVRPQFEKDPARLSPIVRKGIDSALTSTGKAEALLSKLGEGGVPPEFAEVAVQAGRIAEENVAPARRNLEMIPLADNKPEQLGQLKTADEQIEAALAALRKLLAYLNAEKERIAKTRELAAEVAALAENQDRLRDATEKAQQPATTEEIAKEIERRILDAQKEIAADAADLAKKIDDSGFKSGTEHRAAAQTTKQAADHLGKSKRDEAAAAGRQAAQQLAKSSADLAKNPPGKPSTDPLDPPFPEAAQQLAQRQERVNEALAELKKGDAAKALAALQKDVAEQAKALAERTKKLADQVEKGGNPQKGMDAKGASDMLGKAVEEAERAAAALPHINNVPKISPPKVVEGPQSPSDKGGNPDGGQGTKGGGSNTGAGSSKSPSPSNNNQNNTIGKGKNLGKATLTAEALLNQKPSNASTPSGGSGTELQADAAELLRKGLATLMADNNPLAKGFGGFGGGASGEPVPPSPPKEFSAEGSAPPSGESSGTSQSASGGDPKGGPMPGRGGPLGAGRGTVANRLGTLGISGNDWLRLPSDLRSEILKAADERAPLEYRELVRRYFQTMARRASQPEAK